MAGAELSRDHVGALVGALGVAVSAEDIGEITHRLNGFLDALSPLGGLPLDSVEPWPTVTEPDRTAP